MRRIGLAAVAALAALAAVAAASPRAPAVAVPRAINSSAKGAPLLAVVDGARGPELGRADTRSLWIARRSPRLRVFNPVVGWVYSPDRGRLAIVTETRAGPTASVQFVSPRSFSRSGTARLGSGHVAALAWDAGGVTAAVDRGCCSTSAPHSIEIVSIDPVSTKVRSRARLAKTYLRAARVRGTVVLLVGPSAGLGTATLVVAAPTGEVRTVELTRIVAGRSVVVGELPSIEIRQNVPGLAVDPATGRAFIVPASGEIAEVSLSDLRVTYHALAQPVSLLGRLHEWVEPAAAAKGINGPVRMARWLGNGILAVTGADETAVHEGNGRSWLTMVPSGLRLIDTNTWGSKLIDRGADSFTVDGAMLLATGARWDSRESSSTGMGLAAYGLDGRRRLAVLGGKPITVLLSFRGRAYVADDGRLKVVDLRDGHVVNRGAPIAQLLIGDGST